MTYYLVYVSTARRLMSPAELHELLVVARERNTAAGLTGALLYRDGTFMQVLEGERSTVEQAYHTIEDDPRHYDVTGIVDGDVATPQFADWSMAFRDLSAGEDEIAAGFSTLMNDAHSDYGLEPTLAQRILLSFRRTLHTVS